MTKVLGELNSLNNQVLLELENLYDYKIPHGQLGSEEILDKMIEISRKINREVAIYVDRRGNVRLVTVGTWDLVKIPPMWAKRGDQGYSGLRCIHTHPSGNSSLSSPDLTALINLKLDAIISLGIKDQISCSIAYLIPVKGKLASKYEVMENITISSLLAFNFNELILSLEKDLNFNGHLISNEIEKALLVIVDWQNTVDIEFKEAQEELVNLTNTAGLVVVDTLVQKRAKKDPGYLVGKGKLNEIALKIQEKQVDCVIFEDALSPSQQSNLIDFLGIKVLDRTNLILDIFAQRAKSKEGKLQVELAQLTYLLPRLTGQGIVLSRLGGGVGTRGPGETKLETDRRHIRKRIQTLKTEIEVIKNHRSLLQNDRKNRTLPIIALIGYTNAGKSSLLNALAEENVQVEDKLFATLDTTTRNIKLHTKQEALLTDTVGFIRNLPHQLISAFKSTLEEVQLADLLLHVIDVNNKNIDNNIQTVQDVLKELNVLDKPIIYVYNKVDSVTDEIIVQLDYQPSCLISAKTGFGLDKLQGLIDDIFNTKEIKIKLHIPYHQGYLLDQAYQAGKVEIENYDDVGTIIFLTASESKIPIELNNLKVME